MPYAFGLDVALSRPKSEENGESLDDDHTPVLPAKPASASSAAPAAAKPAPASTAPAAPKPAAPAANGGAKS
jgi:type IV pilus assembly protein PilN